MTQCKFPLVEHENDMQNALQVPEKIACCLRWTLRTNLRGGGGRGQHGRGPVGVVGLPQWMDNNSNELLVQGRNKNSSRRRRWRKGKRRRSSSRRKGAAGGGGEGAPVRTAAWLRVSFAFRDSLETLRSCQSNKNAWQDIVFWFLALTMTNTTVAAKGVRAGRQTEEEESESRRWRAKAEKMKWGALRLG